MDDDGFTAPSRERFREERRAIRAAERKRKLIGVPVVLLGIGLVGAGAWIYVEGDGTSDVPTQVGGTSIVRTTTTTSTTTTSTTTTTTTTLPPTTLPPTTTTTAKPKPKPKPKPVTTTTAAPVDPAATTVAPPAPA